MRTHAYASYSSSAQIRSYLRLDTSRLTSTHHEFFLHIGSGSKAHAKGTNPWITRAPASLAALGGAAAAHGSSDLAGWSGGSGADGSNGAASADRFGLLPVPEGIVKMATLAEQLTDSCWLVPMGCAMGAFFVCGGPPSITQYTWRTYRSKVDELFVTHHPAVVAIDPRASTVKHDLMDTFELTPFGANTRGTSEARIVYVRVLFCTGRSKMPNEEGHEGPNCERMCGGLGECAMGCPGPRDKSHCCSARIIISATPPLLRAGKLQVELTCGVRRPPPSCQLASWQLARARCNAPAGAPIPPRARPCAVPSPHRPPLGRRAVSSTTSPARA